MKHFLFFLVHPKWWLRNSRINKAWDKWLNDALDDPTYTNPEQYTINLNGVKIWIGNYPYDYGHRFYDDLWNEFNYLPSRKTALKLKRSLEDHYLDSIDGDFFEQEYWGER